MAVEQWIDEICNLWGEVSNGRGGLVRSYHVFDKDEFPEAISVFPCALTYTVEVDNQYSFGGPLIDYWRGVTEFHLFPNVDKRNYPQIMRYFARIRNIAAGHMKLNSKVEHFLLRNEHDGGASIIGPVVLQYGTENPHHGLIVSWTVKENVSGDFTVAI
jgi:hypothetical protein